MKFTADRTCNADRTDQYSVITISKHKQSLTQHKAAYLGSLV